MTVGSIASRGCQANGQSCRSQTRRWHAEAKFRRTKTYCEGLTETRPKTYNPAHAAGGPTQIPSTSQQRSSCPVREQGSWPGDRPRKEGSGMGQQGQSTLEWVIGAAVILGSYAPQRDYCLNSWIATQREHFLRR